jgi:hypothetical protein
MSINPFDDPSIALCLLPLFIRTACLGLLAKSVRSILHLARLTILPMLPLGIICSVMKTVQELYDAKSPYSSLYAKNCIRPTVFTVNCTWIKESISPIVR